MTGRRLAQVLVGVWLATGVHGHVSHPAAAQPRPADPLEAALAARVSGDWQLAVSGDDAMLALNHGIAQAVAALPPLIDVMAASELRARTPVPSTLWIEVTPERIRTRLAGRSYDTAPGLSSRLPVPGDSAARMEVVQLLRGGRLEQIFTTERGRRWNVFTAAADGRSLTLDVVIHSAQLPADVRFQLPYRRTR